MEIHEIKLEKASDKLFDPFGQLLCEKSYDPDFTGDGMESWALKFSSQQDVELMFNRFHYKAFEFSILERHFHVTQTFLPLGGMPMVMIVSEPTDPQDRSSIPNPEDIRAFYIDGNMGVMLWKATWHALHRFPARPPYVDVGLITETETQQELEIELKVGASPKRTEAIDYAKTSNIGFKVVDPKQYI